MALVVATAGAGYALAPASGAPLAVQLLVLGHTLVGTALVAAGASALNQIAERDVDALMARTARRPLPSGRLGVAEAAAFAWPASFLGIAWLWTFAGALTAALAIATLLSYVLAYTPLKRVTPLATLVGAVPGALPIVGGWTAAGGALDARAGVLFAILFLWQLPHFLALGYLYRADYLRAGLKVGVDGDGTAGFRLATMNALALLPVALAPTVLALAGVRYFACAVALTAWYAWAAASAAREPSPARARRLFTASLVYLPLLLGVMIADRIS